MPNSTACFSLGVSSSFLCSSAWRLLPFTNSSTRKIISTSGKIQAPVRLILTFECIHALKCHNVRMSDSAQEAQPRSNPDWTK